MKDHAVRSTASKAAASMYYLIHLLLMRMALMTNLYHERIDSSQWWTSKYSIDGAILSSKPQIPNSTGMVIVMTAKKYQKVPTITLVASSRIVQSKALWRKINYLAIYNYIDKCSQAS